MWLKIETGLPSKLEVFRIAEELQINRAEVVGHLVSLWAWFDFNTENGVIDGISSTEIIDAQSRQGFADALYNVGWLQYNKNWESVGIQKLILPNFDRHNGQTAKKRANAQQRQQRFRNAKALPTASPEKRRVDKEKKKDDTPYEKVVDLWNQYNTPKCEKLTKKRKDSIRELCKEYTLEQIGEAFAKIQHIPFLTGQSESGWKADIEYATRPDKFLKIYEGGWSSTQKGMASTDFDEWNK